MIFTAADGAPVGTNGKAGLTSVAEITRTLKAIQPADHAIEIRAPVMRTSPGAKPINVVERFPVGAFENAARAAYKFSGKAPAVYVVMNGVDPELPTRGRVKGAETADVPRRFRLLIDTDPKRPGTVSATDGEKAKADELGAKIRRELAVRDWPAPIVGDSGNGDHSVFGIDLPNTPESYALVKAVLTALAARFDTEDVKVDTSVIDAPRLVKLYGTHTGKGEDTEERPHRYSRMVSCPERLEAVTEEQLRQLVEDFTPKPAPGFDLAAEIERKQSQVEPEPTPPPNGMQRRAFTATNNRPDAETRARAYEPKCEPSVSGQGGHNALLKAAINLGPGFNLSPEVLLSILRVFNKRCSPEWSEKELKHKVDEAYKVESRRGWLLDADRNGTTKGDNNGGNSRPRDPDAATTEKPHERPTIAITTEEHEVIDKAVAALAEDSTAFQRGFTLVTVQRDTIPGRGIIRPAGSPRVHPLPLPRLRERLTKFAAFVKLAKDRNGNVIEIPAHPPEWVVPAVAVRGEWPGIRPLEAVIESPVLRYDGTILDAPGYDPVTALLFEPNAEFSAVKERPTHEDARASAKLLLDLVTDFPFAGSAHWAAWLAALLTPFARFAIAGPCPLFLFDATTAGSGKTLLADLIALVYSGRVMARKDYPEDNEEMRKTITAIALAGDWSVLLDNVARPLGGSALDAALTGVTWSDRILGRSQMTPVLPLFTVWFATGNNVPLRGDVMRRVVPCRLESKVERPEERTGFKYPKLVQHTQQERPALVTAALTILRAYFAAGRPDQKLSSLGSYEAWSDIVRSAVVWTTGVDPCDSREDLRVSDDTALNSSSIVHGWDELPDQAKGLTCTQAIELLRDDKARKYATLHEALMAWSKNNDLPTARTVGNRLKAIRGQIFGGKYLHSEQDRTGTQLWSVRLKPLPEAACSADSACSDIPPSRENTDDNCNTGSGGAEGIKSMQSMQSMQETREEIVL